MNLTLVGLLRTLMLSKVQREPGWDETSWGESKEGCSSKPQFNTTFPADQKVQVKYLTSNKQEMGKATAAEHGFKPKGVAHLIGMFFFPAFWRNPVNTSESLLMSSIFWTRNRCAVARKPPWWDCLKIFWGPFVLRAPPGCRETSLCDGRRAPALQVSADPTAPLEHFKTILFIKVFPVITATKLENVNWKGLKPLPAPSETS